MFAPVDPSCDLVEAINRLVFRDSGATGYGQRIVWTDYDGIEIDPQGGATLSTGNPTLKIRQSVSGYGIQVRNAANSSDTFSVQDSGVSIGTALAITGNLTVGGTLGVTGATTLSSLGVTGAATVGGTLGVTGATSVGVIGSSGLATLSSLAVTNNATVGGTLGVTGTITGSSTVQGTRLISTIATGTAPLTVASTTQVSNLNASQVVGRAPGTGVGDLAFYDGSNQVVDSAKLAGVAGSGYSVTSHTHTYLPLTGGTISGALSVGGLTSTAALTAGGTITASGPATGLSVTNDATIGGALTVGGTFRHTGSSMAFFGSAANAKQTVTGSRGANAALASLLSALANYGLVTDSST